MNPPDPALICIGVCGLLSGLAGLAITIFLVADHDRTPRDVPGPVAPPAPFPAGDTATQAGPGTTNRATWLRDRYAELARHQAAFNAWLASEAADARHTLSLASAIPAMAPALEGAWDHLEPRWADDTSSFRAITLGGA